MYTSNQDAILSQKSDDDDDDDDDDNDNELFLCYGWPMKDDCLRLNSSRDHCQKF